MIIKSNDGNHITNTQELVIRKNKYAHKHGSMDPDIPPFFILPSFFGRPVAPLANDVLFHSQGVQVEQANKRWIAGSSPETC